VYLLFTCMTTRFIYVKIVTSLDLNSFILAFSRFIDLRGPVSSLYSDNGSTFKAAANVLPELLQSSGLQSEVLLGNLSLLIAHPKVELGSHSSKYSKEHSQTTRTSHNKNPHSWSYRHTFQMQHDLLMTGLSCHRVMTHKATMLSPSSLLIPSLDPVLPIGQVHDRDHLRHDYRYNCALAQQFWDQWVKFYLPQLQRRKKWFKLATNLRVGQMVLVGGPSEIDKRGNYCLGQVVRVLPQWRRGRAIVHRAVISVPTRNDVTGERQVSEIERNLSKIAPFELCE